MNVTVKDTSGQEAGTCFQGRREPRPWGLGPQPSGPGTPFKQVPASCF